MEDLYAKFQMEFIVLIYNCAIPLGGASMANFQ